MFSEKHKSAGVTWPLGFTAAGVRAGIKKSGNLDLAVIYSENEAAVAGVFTQNQVAAAPVHVSKKTVETGTAHASSVSKTLRKPLNSPPLNSTAARMTLSSPPPASSASTST